MAENPIKTDLLAHATRFWESKGAAMSTVEVVEFVHDQWMGTAYLETRAEIDGKLYRDRCYKEIV
jgi:hypothetical protein